MKKMQMVIVAISLRLVVLVIVLGVLSVGLAQAAPLSRPPHAPGDCTVTNTNDSGPGSLRECMLGLQQGATVTFSTSVFPAGSPATIALTAPLPDITTNSVIIDGSNAGVILNGSGTPGGTSGLVIDGASSVVIKGLQILNFPERGVVIRSGMTNNTIGGINATPGGPCSGDCNLISGNGGTGVWIDGNGTTGNIVRGNYIGTDISGTSALGNNWDGVWIGSGASNNTIGGTTAAERNLISGNNRVGLSINGEGSSTAGNMVQGNYIGTDVTGNNALGNGVVDDYTGVEVYYSASNTIENNLISGNRGNGIVIQGDSSTGNVVRGNTIGTNASGITGLGNDREGVSISNGASNNTIGGTTAAARNLISSNNRVGVEIKDNGTTGNIVRGNYIGTDINGTNALSNNWVGVIIRNGATNNTIGGTNTTPGGPCSGDCNLISNNGSGGGGGVWIQDSGTTNNTVSGNYIGTDVNGASALGNNLDGVFIGGSASDNTIGGTTAGQRNIISGNSRRGVEITGIDTNNNRVIGNYIGTDVTGSANLGNAKKGIGINNGGDLDGPKQNIIEKNVISGNDSNGMDLWGTGTEGNIVRNNYIGTGASGNGVLPNQFRGIAIGGGAQNNSIGPGNVIAHNGHTGVGVVGWQEGATINNTITQNSIYSNVYKGIELLDGGNLELFPPILTDVGTNSVKGLAPPNSTIEIFSDAEDEGRYYHGSTTADASGNFAFTQASAFTGANVTATATDGDGNTSEFSAAYEPLVDVKVIAILQPKSSGKANQAVVPTVKIGNAGTTAETGINVSVQASGSALSANYGPHNQTVDLPPLGYATLTFPSLTPDSTGTYQFVATVSLAGDQNPGNDQQNKTVIVSSEVIDLWTRDNETDNGDIPTSSFWQSPDIWVRNADDGGTEHQDPIADQVNWVYMIVRNRGSAASDGADTAKAYWHEPSLGIKCGSWAQIDTGQTIPNTPANNAGTRLIKFSWTPTHTGHTCLHGEIVSDDDPVVNQCDIPWDNNLSQRNVNIIPGGAGMGGQEISGQASGGIVFEVTNIKDKPKPIDLIVDVSNVPDANAVRLDLGSDLAARWASVDGETKSSGIEWNGGSTITVTNANSGTIAGIPMDGGETQTVTMLVNAPSVETTTVTVYEAIDAGPGVASVDAIVGGNTYFFSTRAIYLPIVFKNN